MIQMQKPVWHDRSIHARALWLYWRELRVFLALLIPLALAAYGVEFGFDYLIHHVEFIFREAAFRNLLRHDSPVSGNMRLVALLGFLRYTKTFLVFLIYGFGYAAVVAAVHRYQFGTELTARLAARDVSAHGKTFLQSAGVLFLLCTLAGIGVLLSFLIFVPFGRMPPWFINLWSWIVVAAAIGALARWAYVIPQAGIQGASPRVALQESSTMTQRDRPRLWWLMIESEVITFLGSQAPWWIAWAAHGFRTQWPVRPWEYPVELSASYLITAVLIPIPMIGTALLYTDELERRHPEMAAAATVE